MKNKTSRDPEAVAKRKQNDDDSDVSDVESVGSVEFNDYLDTLMVGKRGAKSLNFAEDVENSKKKGKKTKEGLFGQVFYFIFNFLKIIFSFKNRKNFISTHAKFQTSVRRRISFSKLINYQMDNFLRR